MNRPVQLVGHEYGADEIQLLWGVTRTAVVEWLESGALQRNEFGQVTRPLLIRFLESEQGQALLAEARAL